MDFQVTIQNLDQLIAALRQAPTIAAPILQRALSASQAILAKYTIKGIVPWRTGFLAQTFQAQLSSGMLRWFPTASYAPFVEFGTKPHVILPKSKTALFWPGANHPVRSVNHPGTKPNPFMERIVAAAQPDIDTVFGTALRQITEAIASQA
ncbi:MAG TPA: HK97 gp10 family phage protein [Xanthobacteraceae bacterium]|nr:HK97 gp10 family phage protein [Xanthobacteraceae bacterium]